MLDALKRISMALGLMAATAGAIHAQAPASNYNQTTANAVAAALRSSANLSPFRIEIETRDGMTTLSGTVSTLSQKAEALGLAQRVPGVSGVVDQISVGNGSPVERVQYQVAMGGHKTYAGAGGGDIIYEGGAPGGPSYGGGMAPGGPSYGGGMAPGGPPMDGPMPEGPAGAPGATNAAAPGNPNYAWPSYAPHPNFSAVGYPTAYPWQAWPNIAPPYPYPEVPLDWRAVTLRWDDGIWWLDFKKNYTRPFFTPYPFGLFAY
jgi:BON domain